MSEHCGAFINPRTMMSPQCDTDVNKVNAVVRCVRPGICSRLYCYCLKAEVEASLATPGLSLVTCVQRRLSQMEAGEHMGQFLAHMRECVKRCQEEVTASFVRVASKDSMLGASPAPSLPWTAGRLHL